MAETREMAANTTKFKSDGPAKLNCFPEKSGVVVVVVKAGVESFWNSQNKEGVNWVVRTRREWDGW